MDTHRFAHTSRDIGSDLCRNCKPRVLDTRHWYVAREIDQDNAGENIYLRISSFLAHTIALQLIALAIPEVLQPQNNPGPRPHTQEAILNIQTDFAPQKELLKDAKAELLLDRKRRKRLVDFYKHMRPFASNLVSIDSTLRTGFSHKLSEFVGMSDLSQFTFA